MTEANKYLLKDSHPPQPVVSGVPQGTVLGPLLFLLYINDLPQKVSSTARLFADDSLLYLQISSTADTAELQRDIDRLQQWEKDWQMSFNPSKCEVIRITTKRNPIKATYQIHDHDLSHQDREISGRHNIRGPLLESSCGSCYKKGKQQSGLPPQEPVQLSPGCQNPRGVH